MIFTNDKSIDEIKGRRFFEGVRREINVKY